MENMKSTVLYHYYRPERRNGLCRSFNTKHCAITSAIYSLVWILSHNTTMKVHYFFHFTEHFNSRCASIQLASECQCEKISHTRRCLLRRTNKLFCNHWQSFIYHPTQHYSLSWNQHGEWNLMKKLLQNSFLLIKCCSILRLLFAFDISHMNFSD